MLIGWFSVVYWNKMGRKLRGIFCLFQNPENWFFPRILLANFRVPWKYFCTDFLSHLAIVKPLKWRSWILYSYWLKFSRALSSRQIQGARWFDREMDRLSVKKPDCWMFSFPDMKYGRKLTIWMRPEQTCLLALAYERDERWHYFTLRTS